jgi:hypothetical protein
MESKATLWENSEEIFRIAGRNGVQNIRAFGSIVCWWSIWGQYPGFAGEYPWATSFNVGVWEVGKALRPPCCKARQRHSGQSEEAGLMSKKLARVPSPRVVSNRPAGWSRRNQLTSKQLSR